MARYAEGTSTSVEKSRSEIESTLMRYGATQLLYHRTQDQVMLAFEYAKLPCKLILRYPDIQETSTTETGRKRTLKVAEEAREAEIRRRWRVLLLSVKARLESIAAGCETPEQAFGGIILLKSGRTVSEEIMLGNRQGSFLQIMAPEGER